MLRLLNRLLEGCHTRGLANPHCQQVTIFYKSYGITLAVLCHLLSKDEVVQLIFGRLLLRNDLKVSLIFATEVGLLHQNATQNGAESKATFDRLLLDKQDTFTLLREEREGICIVIRSYEYLKEEIPNSLCRCFIDGAISHQNSPKSRLRI